MWWNCPLSHTLTLCHRFIAVSKLPTFALANWSKRFYENLFPTTPNRTHAFGKLRPGWYNRTGLTLMHPRHRWINCLRLQMLSFRELIKPYHYHRVDQPDWQFARAGCYWASLIGYVTSCQRQRSRSQKVAPTQPASASALLLHLLHTYLTVQRLEPTAPNPTVCGFAVWMHSSCSYAIFVYHSDGRMGWHRVKHWMS